jgi:hypothetical protein
MSALSALFDQDWRRISRWAFLGVIVMTVWLLMPAARCSYASFRDTPLTEYDAPPGDPADADKTRVDEGKDFAGSWMHSVKICYERTPLFGQEPWKADLLLGFAFVTVLGWGIYRLSRRTID